jgi:drug/metabolite transporter (DMT)-like permease
MTPLEWGLLLILGVLWGGSYFFTGIALRELPPFSVVALRVGIAAVILNLLIASMGLRLPRSAKARTAFFGMALLNNALPFCLIVWGQTHIASGLAAILNATTPLSAVIVAHFLTADEKMATNRIIGVLVGLLGVVVLVGPSILAGLGVNAWAQLAVLGSSISYTFAGVFGRRFRSMGIPPLVTATGQLTAAVLLLAPLALMVDRPWMLAMPHAATWGAVLGIAALSTALAYVIYFRILATAGATNLLLVSFLVPVTAIVLGTLVLGERLEARHFLGMALIGACLAAIDGRLLRRTQKT